MAIPGRHRKVQGPYFVTSKTWDAHAIFQLTPNCEVFVETLLHYRDRGVYLLHGFVLMPNHFHIHLTPDSGVTLERAVQFVKRGSAKKIGELHQHKSPVWQRGFSDHRVRDSADFQLHLRYIEQNPVKRHLCTVPGEYRWSSATGSYRMDPATQGLKPLEKASRFGTAEAVP